MKKAYVITEGRSDAEILKRLLPEDILKSVEVLAGAGRYSAQSLARSILAVKRLPVALVLDADTRDDSSIQEQKDFLQESLAQASSGAPFEIFLAVPSLEVLFFERPAFIESLSQHSYSQSEWDMAKFSPGAFLSKSLGDDFNEAIVKLLDNLDEQTIETIRKNLLVKALTEFLSSAIEAEASSFV